MLPAVLILLALLGAAVPVAAQQGQAGRGAPAALPQPVEIGRADPRRKILLDALRPAIERDLGQPVQFVVRSLKVQGAFAFAVVRPRDAAGRAIDFRQTRYAEALEAGAFDGDTTYALLHDRGTHWIVRDFAVGPTDVAYADWPERYNAPAALLGLGAAE